MSTTLGEGTPPNAPPPAAPPVITGPREGAAAFPPARAFYWSVRRELWENRSLTVAPLAVTGLVLFSSLVNTLGLPGRVRNLSALDPAKQHAAVVGPFSMAPAPIMLAALLVGLFYSIDALYGERRDRSILFWKSLPVSDLTTVLSKAAIPIVLLPLFAFALSAATLHVMLVFGSAVLIASGVGAQTLWSELRFVQEHVVMIYGLTVHALWFAPIYSWCLLVSAWARRAPLLWAVLPFAAIAAVEKATLGSSWMGAFLKYRLAGAMEEGFAFDARHFGAVEPLSEITPARFLSAPGLWIGLAFAAAFLAAAVRLRRDREPI